MRTHGFFFVPALLLGGQVSLAQYTYDLTILEAAAHRFVEPGTYRFKATLKNEGTQYIANVRLNWRVNGGPVQFGVIQEFEEPIPGYLNSGGRARILWPADVSFPTTGVYEIKAWCSHLNGMFDQDPSDDTLVHTVHVLPYVPEKDVFLDFYTHHTCYPCAETIVDIDTMVARYPGRIHHMSVHAASDDPLSTGSTEALNDMMGVYGHPSLFSDRFVFPYVYPHPSADHNLDPVFWFYYEPWLRVDHRLDYAQPVEVSVLNLEYNPITRLLTFDVQGEWFHDMSGDFAFNAYIVEDSIYGAQAGMPMPHYHRNVMRHATNGLLGNLGMVPGTVSAGSVIVHPMSTTVNFSWNADHVKVIGVLQHVDPTDTLNRAIINSDERHIMDPAASTHSTTSEVAGFSLWPNPVVEMAHIGFNAPVQPGTHLTLVSADGKQTGLPVSPGVSTTSIDLSQYAPGLYTILLSDPTGMRAVRFVKH